MPLAGPVPPSPPDAELVRRAAGGEDEAFAALYARYQGPVYRFARMMSGVDAIAEEITQDVFVTLMRDLARYEPGRSQLSTYLYGIARNLTRNRMRRERHLLRLEFDGCAEPVVTTDPCAALARAQEFKRLRRAMRALPSRYREVVILAHLHGLPYSEIAAIVQVPIGTVRSRLSRARQMLAASLGSALRCAV
jgi:RNA polymerase sigma-70 factor (ECF subfamily)